jgi:hypothetical protein
LISLVMRFLAGTAVLAAGVAAVSPTLAGNRLSCQSSGTTMKKTARIRVFRATRRVPTPPKVALYACLRPHGSVTLLTYASETRGRIANHGRFVAVDIAPFDKGPAFSLLTYALTRTGRTSARYYDPGPPGPAPDRYPGDPRRLGVTDIVLSAHGRATFIQSWRYPGAIKTTYDVVRTDTSPGTGNHAKGRTSLLDSGTEIKPHSLNLSASTITWSNGGETRSAPLH